MGFLAPKTPDIDPLPAVPPAAAPASMANPAIAMTAANQRKKARAAASSADSTPDFAAAPSTAKNALLGPT